MKLRFIGAARTVTGSMHYLEINGTKILLDCGLIQGRRKEAFELNRTLPFIKPSEIDFVILSHAHIDHSGNLPNLVRHGFNGPIYSTAATRDLSAIMLRDSAHIQTKDVEFINKRRVRDGKNPFEPLYTDADVLSTIDAFMSVSYRRKIRITPDIALTFYDAGHILGSAVTVLDIKEKDREIRFAFSGDLGRPDMPIIKDPEPIPEPDFMICESTYGGRFHDAYDVTELKMLDLLKKAIERKSKIIAPAFSVGRTQEMLYLIYQLFEKYPEVEMPIIVDSPLSVNATEVFKLHPECFDEEMAAYFTSHKDPFGFSKLTSITHAEHSRELNNKKGPMLIISASGMAEAGRVVHHLANNIENPNNIILMTGYCAENTLGRKIIERSPELNILGEVKQLRAEVVTFNSLSAHADSDELISYMKNFTGGKLKEVFLVHGDYDQQQKFQTRLNDIGLGNVTIPSKGDQFDI